MKSRKFIKASAAQAFLAGQLERAGMTAREMASAHISRYAVSKI